MAFNSLGEESLLKNKMTSVQMHLENRVFGDKTKNLNILDILYLRIEGVESTQAHINRYTPMNIHHYIVYKNLLCISKLFTGPRTCIFNNRIIGGHCIAAATGIEKKSDEIMLAGRAGRSCVHSILTSIHRPVLSTSLCP